MSKHGSPAVKNSSPRSQASAIFNPCILNDECIKVQFMFKFG
jgi:hypothetical protein